MKPIKTNDLDTPWFVIEEIDEVFSGNTNRTICYQSDFGPVQISLNSVQSIPRTHRRRRMAHLMSAAPLLYEALWELFHLLEQHRPSWYSREHYQVAYHALVSADPSENSKEAISTASL